MKVIILHDFHNSNNEVEVDAYQIIDMNWASFSGGSVLHLKDGKTFMADENPNHVSLLAEFITGDHCAVGSHSGRYYFGRDK